MNKFKASWVKKTLKLLTIPKLTGSWDFNWQELTWHPTMFRAMSESIKASKFRFETIQCLGLKMVKAAMEVLLLQAMLLVRYFYVHESFLFEK